MTEREIKHLEQMATNSRKRITNREEALLFLMRAGIFDKDGNWTKPYKNLGRAVRKLNVQRKA
jgi:hypothetical protein